VWRCRPSLNEHATLTPRDQAVYWDTSVNGMRWLAPVQGSSVGAVQHPAVELPGEAFEDLGGLLPVPLGPLG
jgi:hypothetical protein